MLLVLFHVNDLYILQVWLCLSFHEISVSVHFNYVVDLSVYLRHFICWCLPFWLWASCGISYIEIDLVIDSVVIRDSISLVFFIWCQLIVIQLSDSLSQFSVIQLSAIIWHHQLLEISGQYFILIIIPIVCLLIKETITRGKEVIAW